MKIMIHNGDEYVAERIIKKDKDIIGYNNDSDIPAWSFKGVKDFTQFQLAEGQEWDVDEKIAEANYLIDLDFRLALLELGV